MKPEKVFLWIAAAIFLGAGMLFLTHEPTYEIYNAVKPITILQYSGFVLFAFLIHLAKPKLERLNDRWIDILVIFCFFAAMAVFFEVLWVYFYWFSVFTGLGTADQLVLDSISYTPHGQYLYKSLSLNVAIKHNVFLFFLLLYALYTLHWIKLERLLEKRQK